MAFQSEKNCYVINDSYTVEYSVDQRNQCAELEGSK